MCSSFPHHWEVIAAASTPFSCVCLFSSFILSSLFQYTAMTTRSSLWFLATAGSTIASDLLLARQDNTNSTCLSYGIDFVSDGEYFINSLSNVDFTAVSQFQGCNDDQASVLLVEQSTGNEWECSSVPTVPDNVAEMSTCPLEKSQMSSGDWSLLVIGNNADGNPFAYERDFSLTVGPQITTTVTPTVVYTATSTPVINTTSKSAPLFWRVLRLTVSSNHRARLHIDHQQHPHHHHPGTNQFRHYCSRRSHNDCHRYDLAHHHQIDCHARSHHSNSDALLHRPATACLARPMGFIQALPHSTASWSRHQKRRVSQCRSREGYGETCCPSRKARCWRGTKQPSARYSETKRRCSDHHIHCQHCRQHYYHGVCSNVD